MSHPSHQEWYFVLDEPARILVADDDPIFCEFATVHMASPVAQVVTAQDGADAWTKLCCEPFDLALVDLGMPKMDGFELTQRIRSHPTLNHLPVVVVTGREDIRSIDKAYALGATSFVAKPVNWRLLSHQVKYVLRMGNIERQIRVDRDHWQQLLSSLKSQLLACLTQDAEEATRALSDLAKSILYDLDNPGVGDRIGPAESIASWNNAMRPTSQRENT